MTARHELLGRKVQVYQRANSPYWQCAASIGRTTISCLDQAGGLGPGPRFRRGLDLTLKGKERFGGGIPKGKTFRQAADQFLREYEVITRGGRAAPCMSLRRGRSCASTFSILWRQIPIPGLVQEYQIHRATSRANKVTGEVMRPAHSTMHQ